MSRETEILTQKQLIEIVWGKDDIAVQKSTIKKVKVTLELNWCARFHIPLSIPNNRGDFALDMYNVHAVIYRQKTAQGISTLLGVNWPCGRKHL